MIRAMGKMVRQHIIHESQMAQRGQAIAANTATLGDLSQRVNDIEAELGNDERFISVGQSEQISEGVRAIGLIFSKNTGRNEYGGVYAELYRRYGINSYKLLPAGKFDEAMHFLRGWWEELTDNSNVPFLRPTWSEHISIAGGGHEPHATVSADFPRN